MQLASTLVAACMLIDIPQLFKLEAANTKSEVGLPSSTLVIFVIADANPSNGTWRSTSIVATFLPLPSEIVPPASTPSTSTTILVLPTFAGVAVPSNKALAFSAVNASS